VVAAGTIVDEFVVRTGNRFTPSSWLMWFCARAELCGL